MRKDSLFVAIMSALAGSALLVAAPIVQAGGSEPMASPAASASGGGQQSDAASGGDDNSPDSQQPKTKTLPAITVTATRRTQNIDTVPVPVTAISGYQRRMAGVQDTRELMMLAPSLYITTSGSQGSGTVIRMRGVGTSASNAGLEGSVGVFVDGVYRLREGAALQDLYDVKRIAVLRGPQGTLFGKTTSAGVISVHTNKPTFVPEAYVDLSIGNYASRVFTGVWSGPLTNDLAVRVAAHYNKRDGYIENVETGEMLSDRNRKSVRLQALWEPSNSFSMRVIADAMRKREACCAAPFAVYGPPAVLEELLGANLIPAPAYDKVATDFGPLKDNMDMSGLSAEMNWTMDWGKAKLILSNRQADTDARIDGDRTNLDLFNQPDLDHSFESRSANFTLQGEAGRVDWMTGLFYSNSDISFFSRQEFGEDTNAYLLQVLPPATPPNYYPAGTGNSLHSQQDGRSWSLYTHNIIHMPHGFNLTLGARYTSYEKDGSGFATSDVPTCKIPAFPASAKLLCGMPHYDAHYEDDATIGTVALSKDLGDHGIVYASYATGFKAGGISQFQPGSTDPVFEPETVEDYELGLKLAFPEKGLSLRTNLFLAKYDDLQINTFNGRYLFVGNAASATTKGVELAADWRIAPGFRLTGHYTYNPTEYGEDTLDETKRGMPLTNAPENAASFSFNVNQPVGSNTGFANLTARYQSEVRTGSSVDPNKLQDAYTTVNARVGLRFQNGFSVSLWGKNLTDVERYVIIYDSIVQPGNYNAFPVMPRTYGIEFRMRF